MELTLRAAVVVGVALWCWALVDIARRAPERWQGGREEKVAWFIGVAVSSVFGALAYLVYGRGRAASSGRT